ncbi:MAG TPA: MBG domain-containing protein, partial [Isosphaeraceae bacterium]|nr:MBG domain-containing protein [Isosphaeraceae bacterium]
TVNTARLIVMADNVTRSFLTPNPQSFGWDLVREDAPQTTVSAADPDPELTGTPVLSTQAGINSAVGTYPITPAQGTLAVANPNYLLDVSNFQPGTFTITQATLVITANPASRAYGAADPTFTDTISGFINGQTLATSGVTGAPSFTTTASSTSHVGNTYEVVAGIGTLQSGDYLFSFIPGTLTITPAPLTIMANNTSQPFGTTPSLSASYIGLVNGDTAASLAAPAVLSTTATGTSLPGTYPITVSGASSADYSITYESGTFTVQQSSTCSSLEGPILRSSVTSPVTFTVDVSSFSESSVPLTGAVAFYDQAQMIGAVPVVNGIATLSTSALAEGDYMVYAVYQGDTNYEPSSTGTITQMVMSTAPAAPVKRATPIPAHPKKAAPKPKAKAPAPKPKAHPVVKPKAHSATKPQAAVPVKTHVKPAVVRTKR